MSMRRLEVEAGLPSLALTGEVVVRKGERFTSSSKLTLVHVTTCKEGMRIIPLYCVGIEGYLHKVQVAELFLVP